MKNKVKNEKSLIQKQQCALCGKYVDRFSGIKEMQGKCQNCYNKSKNDKRKWWEL